MIHEGRVIPILFSSSDGDVELSGSWVDQFYAIIRTSLQVLGMEEQAVQQASAWRDSDAEEVTSEDDPATGDGRLFNRD